MAPTLEPPSPSRILLSFPFFSLSFFFFSSRYSARNPGVGFAGPGKYASDKGDPPAVESLSAAITRRLSRDDRIFPVANLPVLPPPWDPRAVSSTPRMSWKMPRRFFDRLIRRISDVIKTLIAFRDPGRSS